MILDLQEHNCFTNHISNWFQQTRQHKCRMCSGKYQINEYFKTFEMTAVWFVWWFVRRYRNRTNITIDEIIYYMVVEGDQILKRNYLILPVSPATRMSVVMSFKDFVTHASEWLYSSAVHRIPIQNPTSNWVSYTDPLEYTGVLILYQAGTTMAQIWNPKENTAVTIKAARNGVHFMILSFFLFQIID